MPRAACLPTHTRTPFLLLLLQESHPEAGEVVAFRQERALPPLPLAQVSGLLQYTGITVKTPQKLPAVNVSAKPVLPAACCGLGRRAGGRGLLGAAFCC